MWGGKEPEKSDGAVSGKQVTETTEKPKEDLTVHLVSRFEPK